MVSAQSTCPGRVSSMARDGREQDERDVSGTISAALALTTRKKRESLSGRRKHSESVPDICLAPTGVLRGTGSWPDSSNTGRRVKDASRAPKELFPAHANEKLTEAEAQVRMA